MVVKKGSVLNLMTIQDFNTVTFGDKGFSNYPRNARLDANEKRLTFRTLFIHGVRAH